MKIIISILFVLLLQGGFCQNRLTNITYDFLTISERWKLIVEPNDSFYLTSNQLFWEDTAIFIQGKISRRDSTSTFICDSTKLKEKYLLGGKSSNDRRMAQGDDFRSFENYIHFLNDLKRFYSDMSFPSSVVGTYYRGDGKWSNLIRLNKDNTYTISESVHGWEEYTETGRWQLKKGHIIFIPKKKDSRWLEKYASNMRFYLTDDFLIGRNTKKTTGVVYYYFCKTPVDW